MTLNEVSLMLLSRNYVQLDADERAYVLDFWEANKEDLEDLPT